MTEIQLLDFRRKQEETKGNREGVQDQMQCQQLQVRTTQEVRSIWSRVCVQFPEDPSEVSRKNKLEFTRGTTKKL